MITRQLSEIPTEEITATQPQPFTFTPHEYLKLAVMAGLTVWLITRTLDAIFSRPG
jgi:hypothetical protein